MARICYRLLSIITGCMLMALMMVTTVDVIGRYLFNSPLMGSTELTEFGLSMLIFSALPLVSRANDHITVDLIDTWFTGRFRKWRDFVSRLLIIFSLAVLGYGIYLLALRQRRDSMVTEILHIPTEYVYWFMVVMTVIAMLYSIIGVWQRKQP